MNRNLQLYSKIAIVLLVSSISLWMLNDLILNMKIPIEIIGYIVFFSLGIFIGVHCCIDAIKRHSINQKN